MAAGTGRKLRLIRRALRLRPPTQGSIGPPDSAPDVGMRVSRLASPFFPDRRRRQIIDAPRADSGRPTRAAEEEHTGRAADGITLMPGCGRGAALRASRSSLRRLAASENTSTTSSRTWRLASIEAVPPARPRLAGEA